MNLKQKQSGLTFIGFVIIMALIAFFVGVGLKLYPLYYEKIQVISAMETVTNRPDAAKLSPTDVRKYFMRNIALTNITRFDKGEVKKLVKVIKGKKGEPNQIRVKYESESELLDDLSVIMYFEEYRPLGSGE